MFLPIKMILDDMKLGFENIINNVNLSIVFLKKINNYYRIDIDENLKLFSILDLEKTIFELVNSHSIMFHHFHNSKFPKYSQGSISDNEFEAAI